jgi:hypothetical protein
LLVPARSVVNTCGQGQALPLQFRAKCRAALLLRRESDLCFAKINVI